MVKVRMEHVWENFKNIDKMVNAFKKVFIAEMSEVCFNFYPVLIGNEVLEEKLGYYAEEFLNFTDSVIDKDNCYNQYRKSQELINMCRYMEKIPPIDAKLGFQNQVYEKVKQLIVRHDYRVYDLSAEGFRMIDVNIKVHVYRLVADVIEQVLPQQTC